jgi:predicted secreted acid phosphatase
MAHQLKLAIAGRQMKTRISALVPIIAAMSVLTLAGCGSMKESIRTAQSSADRAEASAEAAQKAADTAANQAQSANSAAQRAQAAADQANSKADAVSAKVDQFIADQQEAANRRRGRNMAMAGERG